MGVATRKESSSREEFPVSYIEFKMQRNSVCGEVLVSQICCFRSVGPLPVMSFVFRPRMK